MTEDSHKGLIRYRQRIPFRAGRDMVVLLTCALLLLIASLLVRWLRLPVESRPDCPKVLLLEGDGHVVAHAQVPRILWSYWHCEEVPQVVRRCLSNWQRQCPGWEIHLIRGSALLDHVDPTALPVDFDRLTPARRSDWLRLSLLSRHGGVWIDASTILTGSLDWLVDAQARTGAEFLGHYLEGFCTVGNRPVIDSWCMAAPPGMPFVNDWYDELCRALAAGDETYLDALRRQGRAERILQRISRPACLIVHVCAQVVLEAPRRYRIVLCRAEETGYFLQQVSHWRRLRLYRRLLAHPAPARPPRLMKLRGGKRSKLEAYVSHHLYRHDSIVGRYLP